MGRKMFVYGTLKRAYSAAHIMPNSIFVKEATTTPHYRLFSAGPFPCLKKSPEEGRSIRGEIFDVDDRDLPRLDTYEGVAHGLFSRGPISIQDMDEPVEAYFYGGVMEDRFDIGESWEG